MKLTVRSLAALVYCAAVLLFAECKKDTCTTCTVPLAHPEFGPKAGNPDGKSAVPAGAGLEDVSSPDQIVGNGTPESCDCQAVVDAVAKGGKIIFNCGDKPVTITMNKPAKVVNDANPYVIIDGGGLVTLSGGGTTRILYMNTCDQDQHWTTPHCDNQEFPQLTVQNITFADGNSIAESEYDGGGAIWVRGGRFKAVNTRFFNNVCRRTGADAGGGAIRAFGQYDNLPVYITNCTFGGAQEYGNYGANGGAISGIGTSFTLINTVLSCNRVTGSGGNPAQPSTPGGGSGGAIYCDGNTMTLSIMGCKITDNEAVAYGSSIFFVSNDHSGNILIDQSIISNNIGGSWYPIYPSISMHTDTRIDVTNSIIE